jgi:hypothetical protein
LGRGRGLARGGGEERRGDGREELEKKQEVSFWSSRPEKGGNGNAVRNIPTRSTVPEGKNRWLEWNPNPLWTSGRPYVPRVGATGPTTTTTDEIEDKPQKGENKDRRIRVRIPGVWDPDREHFGSGRSAKSTRLEDLCACVREWGEFWWIRRETRETSESVWRSWTSSCGSRVFWVGALFGGCVCVFVLRRCGVPGLSSAGLRSWCWRFGVCARREADFVGRYPGTFDTSDVRNVRARRTSATSAARQLGYRIYDVDERQDPLVKPHYRGHLEGTHSHGYPNEQTPSTMAESATPMLSLEGPGTSI